MATKKQSKTTRNDKFKVVPNLSLKGKDLLTRLRNRSLILSTSGFQYSLEDEIDASRKMTRLDIINRSRQIQKDIETLGGKLNQQPKPIQ